MATLTPGIHVEDREPPLEGRGPSGRNGGGGGDPEPHGDWQEAEGRLRRYRIGLAIGLASVTMIFVSLTSAYVVRQGVGTWDDARGAYVLDWRPLNILPILWWNTALLLLSSLTVELARRKAFRHDVPVKIAADGTPIQGRSIPWLAITVILGMGFLTGQYVAWQQLRAQGIYLATNPSSSFFYVLTAVHGLHLFGGLVALAWAAVASGLARPLESRRITVDIAAWYWHFMGVLWVYVLALLHYAK